LVIDEAGARLGEFMTEDAIRLAEERGLDLVEVAPSAQGRPPVCKIADYGRMKYEKKKRDNASRKKQMHVQMKEIKVRPKTDGHDMAVKVRHTRKFLEEGAKVKVTVRFRGRELAHRNIGSDQCLAIADAAKDLGQIEAMPRMEGRQMFMILAPLRRPQPKPVKKSKHEIAADEAAAAAAAAAPDEAAAAASDQAAPDEAAAATADDSAEAAADDTAEKTGEETAKEPAAAATAKE